MSDKDTKFLYNKIVNLEVIAETILELLIEGDVFTEKEFEDRVKTNVEMIQREMGKVVDDMEKKKKSDDPDAQSGIEGLKNVMWGSGGEA